MCWCRWISRFCPTGVAVVEDVVVEEVVVEVVVVVVEDEVGARLNGFGLE